MTKSAQYTQLDIELEPQSAKDKPRWRLPEGWRFTVWTGTLITFLVLWANIGLLVWAQTKAHDIGESGVVALYEGTCLERDNIFRWSHIAINIFSTLLLGASSVAMQCLCAPDREDIDRLHARGVWMDVGISSLRNLRWIARRRLFLWICLCLSSVPLHLVYNSVIFTTASAQNYPTVLVTSNFSMGGTWAPAMSAMQECQQGGNGRNLKYAAQCSDIPLSITQLQRLQRIAPSMKRLENPECINAFGMDYVSNYRSLLLVSTTITDTASVLHFPVTPGIAWGVGGSYAWMCKDGQFLSGQLNVEGVPCFPKSLNVSNWQMYSYSLVSNGTILVDVDHCLAEPTTTPGCNVNLSRSLLIVVICFNLVKILCFIAVLNVCRSPLITVGDTMASFLERADSTTRDYGSISALEIRRSGAWRQKYRSGMSSTHRFLSGYRPNRKWDVRHLRWHRAASWQRWLLATVVCLSCFIAPLTLLLEYDDPTTNGNNSLKDLWNLGFGSINGLYLLLKLSGKSLTANVLTANSPQLLLSFTYFIYNGVVTQMLLSWEYMQFSTHRKVLRVSAPIGAQRSSYWLQLPYSYAIPLMVAMALLHWLVSQSIFLARINVLEYDGTIDIYQSIDGCGWSPIAIVFALFVGGIMVLALPVLGAQRYPNTMPFAGSNTAAISAACHRGDNEDATISRQPLKYGVLMCLGPEGRRRVGFSADEVEPLVEGEHYE